MHLLNTFGRTLILTLLTAASLFAGKPAMAQTDTTEKRFKLAVFLPLYLDSAFDASGNYRYNKTVPPFMNAGMEAWLGVSAAIDTLKKEGIPADIHIFDSRTGKSKPELLIQEDSLRDMDLLVGQVNVNEAALLSRYAGAHKIPFINLNLPNEAGTTANPYHILLNPTLATHCTGIYKFLQKNFALNPVYFFKKKGAQEDRILGFFKDAEKKSASVPLKVKYINTEDSVDIEQLRSFLDTSKMNVIVTGSLDLNYGTTLLRQLSALGKSYKTTIIGMPTWEQADLTKPQFRGVDVYYSTTVSISPDNKLAPRLQLQLKTRNYTRTTETTYRAFEALYWLAHLYDQPKEHLLQKIQQPANLLFTGIDIQPVTLKPATPPDFSENKKLYFIKKTDGQVKGVF